MRRTVIAAALAVSLAPFTAACGEDVSAEALCSLAQAQLELADTSISAGERVRITGFPFVTGCGPDAEPLTDLELVLHQRGTAYALGTADARADGTAVWTVTMPDALREGRARLRAGTSGVLRVRVEPGAAD